MLTSAPPSPEFRGGRKRTRRSLPSRPSEAWHSGRGRGLYFVIALLAACAPAAASPPEQVRIVTHTPAPPISILPTHTPRSIDSPYFVTVSPINPMQPSPTVAASLTPTLTDSPEAAEMIGTSVEGRALTADRFGSGSQTLVLIGGIHGGYEQNTVRLMEELSVHFRAHPDAIPTGAALVIIPVANPDGLARGQNSAGRFNGHGVDLNRNWSCEWSAQAYWRDQLVSAGTSPMSEPETQAIAAYLLRIQPAAALFFHSAANGVFAGNCNGDHGSAALSEVFGIAGNYPYRSAFTAYPVTGTAPSWADGQGIPSADVELTNQTDTEFARNLRAVLAVLEWIAEG